MGQTMEEIRNNNTHILKQISTWIIIAIAVGTIVWNLSAKIAGGEATLTLDDAYKKFVSRQEFDIEVAKQTTLFELIQGNLHSINTKLDKLDERLDEIY